MLSKKYTVAVVLALLLLSAATVVFLWQKQGNPASATAGDNTANSGYISQNTAPVPEPPAVLIAVNQSVTIRNYFKFIDDLVRHYADSVPYPLTEHFLVRTNPWLIDSLAETDYYRQMEHGNFVYDQRQMVVLHPGDTLRLPGPVTAAALAEQIKNTRLDINIPAFRLRIVEADSTLYDFPVRVGKNEKKYLGMAGHTVDLRTQTGTGEIIRINRDPAFYKPETGERYYLTNRDDGRRTWMPIIPWLEPAIGGRRLGQLIHPTTNPKTLGKPASHGCIGLKEGDAWRVYYHAPLGTRVVIRYDLTEIAPTGDTLRYNDIYQYQSRRKNTVLAGIQWPAKFAGRCMCDP